MYNPGMARASHNPTPPTTTQQGRDYFLVDVRETPIRRITPTGVETSVAEYEFDMIVYATGFDAVTGSYERIDIRGTRGQPLIDKWGQGPRTYLGLQVSGFPNLMMLVGPHNAATFCNIPRCIEQNVDWVADLPSYMRDKRLERVEPTLEAEDEWTSHVYQISERMLFTRVDSWMTRGQHEPSRQVGTQGPCVCERCAKVSRDL